MMVQLLEPNETHSSESLDIITGKKTHEMLLSKHRGHGYLKGKPSKA